MSRDINPTNMGTRLVQRRVPVVQRAEYLPHGQIPDHVNPSASPGVNPPNDQMSRMLGLGIGLTSVFSEHLLSHPCIVLRRQMQVNNDSGWYHLTPVTVFQVLFNIQRHQSWSTLWKGLTSTFMVKGLGIVTETTISEFTPLPKEISRHSPLRKFAEHLLLKGLSIAVTTPFYAASLVETVQSEIASEHPGLLDCMREGFTRLIGWSTPQTTRLLPVWKLVMPMVVYGVAHYSIMAIGRYTVLLTVQTEMQEDRMLTDPLDDQPVAKTLYEAYYPELLATFTGRLLADICMYPLETVLHRLLLQGTRTIIDNTDTGLGVVPIITRYEGMLDCYRSIILEEGLPALYKGFGALMLQYGIHMVILKITRSLFDFLSQDAASKRKRMMEAKIQQQELDEMQEQQGDAVPSPQHQQKQQPVHQRPSLQQHQQQGIQQHQYSQIQQHKHVTFQPSTRWH